MQMCDLIHDSTWITKTHCDMISQNHSPKSCAPSGFMTTYRRVVQCKNSVFLFIFPFFSFFEICWLSRIMFGQQIFPDLHCCDTQYFNLIVTVLTQITFFFFLQLFITFTMQGKRLLLHLEVHMKKKKVLHTAVGHMLAGQFFCLCWIIMFRRVFLYSKCPPRMFAEVCRQVKVWIFSSNWYEVWLKYCVVLLGESNQPQSGVRNSLL